MKKKSIFRKEHGQSTLVPGQHQIPRQTPAAPPADISSILHQALAFHQAGQLAEAERLYRNVLQANPNIFDALHLLGVIHHQRGAYDEAIRQIGLALKINPKSAAAHNNLGNALKQLKRLDEALKSYDRAISIKPDYVEAFSNRGNTLNELERFDEALTSCDRAVKLKPDYAEGFNNRGIALVGLMRFDEAMASYDRVIALKPDYAEAFSNRADVFNKLNEPLKAVANCESAIRFKPDFAVAYYNRGVALQLLKRFDEALANYDQAIALKSDYAEAFSARGKAFSELKRLDEALACYETAATLKPNLDYLMGDRLHTKMQLCLWSDFERDCSQIVSAIANGIFASVPMPLLAIPAGPADQLKCAKKNIAGTCPDSPVPHWRGERYMHRRIRVAYVSGDLREHPVTALTAGLFEQHDKSRFETIAISLGSGPQDHMSERLKAAFDLFIDVRGKSDQEVAAIIRHLEIDIAVDLNGFTGDARPGIFTQRPAPIQVNYLGFAGTMGSPYWDYIVADRFVIPEECQNNYEEKVVYLPESFMVNDDRRKISPHIPSRRDAGLPEHGFVFCCFNNSYKLTPDVFDIWMQLLRKVEGSVLWFSAPNASAIKNLRAEAIKRSVPPERMVFAPRTPSNEDHLARLRLADLFLDTLYYNAHTTACDALWAGLPLVTHPGQTFAGRVAGSLLHAIGLSELITPSLAEYEALALKLARDPELHTSIKQKLARHREAFPLFNTKRFVRHIEAAYQTMWARYQQGEPPESFDVPPIG
jgi:protein O-GlcNAc transferase